MCVHRVQREVFVCLWGLAIILLPPSLTSHSNPVLSQTISSLTKLEGISILIIPNGYIFINLVKLKLVWLKIKLDWLVFWGWRVYGPTEYNTNYTLNSLYNEEIPGILFYQVNHAASVEVDYWSYYIRSQEHRIKRLVKYLWSFLFKIIWTKWCDNDQ
jgi:hypothetical protein